MKMLLAGIVLMLIAAYAEPVARALRQASLGHPIIRRLGDSDQANVRPVYVRVAAFVAFAALCASYVLRG